VSVATALACLAMLVLKDQYGVSPTSPEVRDGDDDDDDDDDDDPEEYDHVDRAF
jgi:hypothetical protein